MHTLILHRRCEGGRVAPSLIVLCKDMGFGLEAFRTAISCTHMLVHAGVHTAQTKHQRAHSVIVIAEYSMVLRVAGRPLSKAHIAIVVRVKAGKQLFNCWLTKPEVSQLAMQL